MAALNEADFADPASLLAAMGHSTRPEDRIWLDPSGRTSLAPRTGGMIGPVRCEVKDGSVIYRFGSQFGTPEQTMTGGWWIERRELDQLIRFAEVNERTLGYAVRLLCCVPPEWGAALNLLVSVRTRGPLAAWRGLANSASASDRMARAGSRPAAPRGGFTRTDIDARNDIAAWRLHQLYIPGTRREGAADRFFSLVGQWQTEGAPDWLYRPG